MPAADGTDRVLINPLLQHTRRFTMLGTAGPHGRWQRLAGGGTAAYRALRQPVNHNSFTINRLQSLDFCQIQPPGQLGKPIMSV